MKIRSLALTNFRCHASLRLDISHNSNGVAIVGDNATGKTSALEAIYMLSRGVSFRGSAPADLIQHGSEHAIVSAQIELPDGETRVAMQRSRDKLLTRLGTRKNVSVYELARTLPVQIMDPRAHRLIDEGPTHRRRLLDWGMFHVEHSFPEDWRQFQRLLKQRNAACRAGNRDALRAWNPHYVETCQRIDQSRRHHLGRLLEAWRQYVRELLGEEHTALLSYRAGWPKDQALADALLAAERRELESGHTVVGPHRADLRLQLDGRQVRHQASRGQQKALVLALLLAQVDVVSAHLEQAPVLLIDDFGAEWGAGMRQRAANLLNQSGVQWISTWLDQPDVHVDQMFHVEHL